MDKAPKLTQSEIIEKQIAFDEAVEKNDKKKATSLFDEIRDYLTSVHRDILRHRLDSLDLLPYPPKWVIERISITPEERKMGISGHPAIAPVLATPPDKWTEEQLWKYNVYVRGATPTSIVRMIEHERNHAAGMLTRDYFVPTRPTLKFAESRDLIPIPVYWNKDDLDAWMNDESDSLAGDHYMLYWQEQSVIAHASNDTSLDVVASNQLMFVYPGDTLWVVTLTEERELVLAGKMVVGEVVDYEEAIRRMPDTGLWQAEFYAFPEPETEEYLRRSHIHDVANELRFEGENNRLILRDSKLNPKQLKNIRKLTPETAEIFEERFYSITFALDDLSPEARQNFLLDLIESDPNEPMHHYNLGVALNETGRGEEAIEQYQAALQLGYENPAEAYYNIGCGYIDQQRFDDAVNAYNQAILANYELPQAHFMLGVALGELGRYEDAIAATRNGLSVELDPQAHFNIGRWQYLLGMHKTSIESFDQALTGTDDDALVLMWKAKCHRHLGNIDEEIQCYERVLDINAMFLDAIFQLGAAYEIRAAESSEGVEYLESDGRFDLEDPKQLYYFAMGNLALGNREIAEDFVGKLSGTAPELAHRLERALEI